MPGLNTDADPRRVPAGDYPGFRNLVIGKTGVMRPRKGHATTTTVPEETNSVHARMAINPTWQGQVVDFGEDIGDLAVYTIPGASNGALIEDEAFYARQLTIAPSVEGPVESYWNDYHLSYPTTLEGALPGSAAEGYQKGLAPGETRTYANVWHDNSAGQEFGGLGGIVEVENDCVKFRLDDTAGPVPVAGDVLTNTTKGETATVHQIETAFPFPGTYMVLVRESDAGKDSAWEAADAITWPGGGTGDILETQFDAWAYPTFTPPVELGADPQHWMIYALDGSGTWRTCANESDIGWPGMPAEGQGWGTGTAYPVPSWPYITTAKETLSSAYPGPLDADGLVETCIAYPMDTEDVVEHRGCIFVAAGRFLYPSEPLLYRYFVKDRRLDIGSDIIRLIPRDDYLEVWTTQGLTLVIGDYPTHYLRPMRLSAGIRDPFHVCAAAAGTWGMLNDADDLVLGFFSNGQWTSIGTDRIGKWLEDIPTAERVNVILLGTSTRLNVIRRDTVAGDPADHKRVLCFDVPLREWWDTLVDIVPAQPFLSTDGTFYLNGFVSAVRTFMTIHGDPAAPVDWEVWMPSAGDNRYRQLPEWVALDADGDVDLEVYADGERLFSEEVQDIEEREVVLPVIEAKEWHVRLSGTGTQGDTEIRGIEPHG